MKTLIAVLQGSIVSLEDTPDARQYKVKSFNVNDNSAKLSPIRKPRETGKLEDTSVALTKRVHVHSLPEKG